MRDSIIEALKKGAEEKEVNLEIPENETFGDYSSNVALGRKNPRQAAEEIIGKLKEDEELMANIEKIELAGPGFINFWIKKERLAAELAEINEKKEDYGANNEFKDKKLVVEFAHPNTHKLFHIGHLRNITTGEAISRFLEATGAKVSRVNYQGDIGLHIAKALWGIKKIGFKDPKDTRERMNFLGEAYVKGNQVYEEDEKAKGEIIKINKSLYEETDKELIKLYQTTRKWSLDYFDLIYKRVDTKFDRLYFESEVVENGKKRAEEALERGIFEKSDGAVIYPGEKRGLHNRVFITKEGVPTYEAKDLGLAELQFSEFTPDKIIHVVGPEQSGYFEVLFKALSEIDPSTSGKEFHLIYGWVRLKEGKMSSRKGNVVQGEWLLDEVKKRIIETYKTDSEIAEKVAVGAVKYSFLKVGLRQEIAFDIEESISLEGNSGPYLQYTVARTNSVLTKARNSNIEIRKSENKMENGKWKMVNEEELSVLRALIHYSEVVKQAAEAFSPNLLANYLFDLAKKFNNFYDKHRIIGGTNYELRIMLTKATGQILKNGLKILGISTPEKM
jgi:arginyl-tRNA synthetase